MHTREVFNIYRALRSAEPVSFVYEDADGVVSLRKVRVESIERTDEGHTIARTHDLLRDDARTYRIDRMVMAWEPGEQVAFKVLSR